MDEIFIKIPLERAHRLDVVIFSQSLQRHINDFKDTFLLVSHRHLKLYLTECKFSKISVELLGHTVCFEVVLVNIKKITIIKYIPALLNKSSLQRFLGLVGYYCHFVK